jgi:ParB-like chromosome segregation protein Spo0J
MTNKNEPNQKRKVELRDLASLKLHPKHFEFSTPTLAEIASLAEDIKERNLQHLIEITPDGVIIAGRKRWEALKKLKRQKSPCIVRYDLAAKGECAIVEHLVLDNLMRRQHSDLEIARAYRALKSTYEKSSAIRGRDLRDVLGERFGRSGGALDRLCRILDAPRPIQDAYERGEIRQVDAAKVGRMQKEIQHKICADIEAKIPAQVAFNKHSGQSQKARAARSKKESHTTVGAALCALTSATAEIKNFGGGVAPMKASQVAIVQRCARELMAFLKQASRP